MGIRNQLAGLAAEAADLPDRLAVAVPPGKVNRLTVRCIDDICVLSGIVGYPNGFAACDLAQPDIGSAAMAGYEDERAAVRGNRRRLFVATIIGELRRNHACRGVDRL